MSATRVTATTPITAGTDTSSPPTIITRASPMEATARKATKGRMAKSEVGLRLAGAASALSTVSTAIMYQIPR